MTGAALEQVCELDEMANKQVGSGTREKIDNNKLLMAVVVQRQALEVHLQLINEIIDITFSVQKKRQIKTKKTVGKPLVERFERSWRFPRSKESEDHGNPLVG